MPNEPELKQLESQEQLSLYAFGLLDGPEAEEIERRLAADPAWQAELRVMQDTLAALAEPAEVPAGSAERLLARVRAEAKPPVLSTSLPSVSAPASVPANLPLPTEARPVRRLPYGPLLALAAAVAVVLVLTRFNASPERQLARYQAEQGAVTTNLKTKDGQALGTAVRLPDGRAFVLLAADAPQGKAYQAWQVVGAAPQSLGVFTGRSFLSSPLSGKVTLAVSVEPPAGSPQPTTTPILAQLL